MDPPDSSDLFPETPQYCGLLSVVQNTYLLSEIQYNTRNKSLGIYDTFHDIAKNRYGRYHAKELRFL